MALYAAAALLPSAGRSSNAALAASLACCMYSRTAFCAVSAVIPASLKLTLLPSFNWPSSDADDSLPIAFATVSFCKNTLMPLAVAGLMNVRKSCNSCSFSSITLLMIVLASFRWSNVGNLFTNFLAWSRRFCSDSPEKLPNGRLFKVSE